MDDIVITIVRDLPSTAVLILFVWFTSKQFQQAIGLISKHVESLNDILEQCLKSHQLTDKEKSIDRKLEHLSRVIDRFMVKVDDS